MVYEDFTTYMEVDPNNYISKTANHVDFESRRDLDIYLYDDKGINHFKDFEHLIDCLTVAAGAQYGGWCVVWGLFNNVDDVAALQTGNEDGIYVYMLYYAGTLRIYLVEITGGSRYQDRYSPASFDTWYYLTIKKDGTSLTCKIYSDSARTNLIDTLSLTLHSNWNFRYIFVANTFNDGSGIRPMHSDIENLDLQEPPPKILNLGPIGIALEDANISAGDKVILI